MPAAMSPQVIMIRAIQSRAPCTGENQIARDFEQRVPEEEDAGAEAVDRGTQAEVAVHLQRGEPDIHSVQERDDIEDEQKGDQSSAHGAQRCALEGRPAVSGSRRQIVDIDIQRSPRKS